MSFRFRDRVEAGQQLAHKLSHHHQGRDVLVLGLPRGGVPVAAEVAKALDLPWDIWLVRKLGLPHNPETAMGAIAMGGMHLLNQELITSKQIDPQQVRQIADREEQELERQAPLYRQNRPLPELRGKTVIVVDDGIATGSTIRVVIAALRQYSPQRIVVAVPLASPRVAQSLQSEVDEVVTVIQPDPFYAVNLWYQNFPQTTDQEVCQLMERSDIRGTAVASGKG